MEGKGKLVGGRGKGWTSGEVRNDKRSVEMCGPQRKDRIEREDWKKIGNEMDKKETSDELPLWTVVLMGYRLNS